MDAHQQLRALLAILREQGVVRYSSADITLELGPLPLPRVEEAKPPSAAEDVDSLMYWSAE